MKVCFVGLGSIGKKHLKNLYIIANEYKLPLEVHAYRKTKNPLEKEIENLLDRQIYDEIDLDGDYDIVFVTNPTFLHYETIKLFSQKSRNMFIEKPLFEDIDYDINNLKLRKDGIYYVAAPLRYTEVIGYLKELIKKEKVYSIRAICSSYLPDWRPGTDYRTVYSAKRNEGGGVSLDLIHEWDYITYLFGFPKKVFNLQGKFSHLEIDSEDLSVYIAEYEDKLLELHLDYFGRNPKRQIELYAKSGTIIGDFIANKVEFSSTEKKLQFNSGRNDMYLKEIRYFLDCILNGKKNENTIEHAYKVLKLAKGGVVT